MNNNIRTLTIISGVFINSNKRTTVNSKFDLIIKEYSRHWDKINLLGPINDSDEIIGVRSKISKNIFITAIPNYQRKISNRLKLFFNKKDIFNKYIVNSGILSETDLFQVRFPDIFTLILSYKLNKKVNICFYIAGDTIKSVYYNNIYFLPIAIIMKYYENKIIKDKIVVVTGKGLLENYSKLAKVHTYYSTTHLICKKRNPKKHLNKILFVGVLHKLKRVKDLILAIKIIKNYYPSIECNIVGNGSEYNEIKRIIHRNKLSKNVNLCGYISSEKKLNNIYDQSDFLVLPSLTEGTARVLPEAMSRGVIPLAVKNVGSNNYIINHGENGMLLYRKNPSDIAKNIISIIEDFSMYKALLNNIYIYSKKHTLQIEVKKMWDFILN